MVRSWSQHPKGTQKPRRSQSPPRLQITIIMRSSFVAARTGNREPLKSSTIRHIGAYVDWQRYLDVRPGCGVTLRDRRFAAFAFAPSSVIREPADRDAASAAWQTPDLCLPLRA